MTDYPEALVERVVKAAAEADSVLELKWPDDWSEAERHVWRQKIRAALDAIGLREAVEALEAIRAMIPAITRGDRNVIDIADIVYPLLARIKGEPHA